MATRTAKLYSGEDQSPIVDYTDLVIWEESEFGSRAWQGEGNASSITIRDPFGETGNPISLPAGLSFKTLPAKSLFVVQVDSSFLFRGRIGIKNYTRDGQHVERYRQVEAQLHDSNWDLDHIFVHNYTRPAETDQQRAQGLIATYLSGSPRRTTALNGSNLLSASNTVSLAAKTYTRTTPLEVLRDISGESNKQFFVTGDAIGGGSLFWDGNDSTAYACTFTISDRESEVRANPGTYWPPIWNVGPASTEDGSELLSQVVLFYGTGEDQYQVASDPVIAAQYGFASGTFTDDTTESSGAALNRAGKILAHREYEDKTYNVTIGPLTDAQVVLVKHGQTINIKARAITDADDQFRLMRIAQCRYTTPVPGTWFAHLQLGRPWKMAPYGKGPTLVPKPPAQPVAGTCTRLYFSSNDPSVDPAIDSAWEVDSRLPAGQTKTLTLTPDGTYTSSTNHTDSSAGNSSDICLWQGAISMSAALAAVLAAGGATIQGQLLARARSGIGISEASQDMISQIGVRVMQGATTTPRGTALALHTLASSVGSTKWPAQTTKVNRIFPPAAGGNVLSAVSGAVAGDLLIVEVGMRNFTTVTTGGTIGTISAGGTDLPEDEVSTSLLNHWIDICAGNDPGDTPEPVAGSGGASPGSDSGTYAPIDHVHAHGLLSTDATDYHQAVHIDYDPTVAGLDAINVQEAIDEVSAAAGTGSQADPFGWGFAFTTDPAYSTSATSIVANVCRYCRIIGSADVTKIGYHVTTSAGNIGIAVYANSGDGRAAVPSTRTATTGSVACPALGYAETALTVTLVAGDWLAMSASSTAAVRGTAAIAAASALGAGRAYAQTTAHPPPSPAGTLDAGNPGQNPCMVGVV